MEADSGESSYAKADKVLPTRDCSGPLISTSGPHRELENGIFPNEWALSGSMWRGMARFETLNPQT